VLGSIALVSQIYEGATASLWFAGVQVTGTIIVFLLSITRGRGCFLTKNDYAILLAASAGLVLWYFTENAAYALAITISISLLGGLATAVKAYHYPESETLSTWVISFIASGCAMLSVGKVDFVLLAYPVYLFTLYLSFIVAIALGRARRSSGTMLSGLQRVAGPVRAALRTTADAVIVIAALVYVVNNGLPFINAESFAGNTHENGEPDRPFSVNTSAAPTDKSHPDTAIPAPRINALASVQHRNPISTGLIGVAAAAEMTPRTRTLPANYYAALKKPFLTLDVDDPYTQLVVTTASAALYQNKVNTRVSTTLSQGESLIALATNGDWFKVSTTGGGSGFVHRSQLTVALPDLSQRS
ncbi:MAG: hypothetical protein AAF404_00755, partial [Pseudomonadota bacterium]